MKNFKRITALLLCAVMMLATFAACSTNEPKQTDENGDVVPNPDKEITLVYQTTSASDMITTAFAEYKKTHPNVSLDVQVVDNAETSTKYLAQANANALPDFGWYNCSGWVDLFKQTNAVMDLTDIVNNQLGADTFVKDTFLQAMAGDKITCLPAEIQIQGFLINVNLFKEMNLEIPETFEDLVKCAKVFRENGKVLIGSGTSDTWPTWPWYTWLHLWGINDLQEELFKTHSIKWNESDVITAYYKLAELKECGAFPDNNSTISYERSKTMFLAQECGIIPTSTDQLTGITGSDLDKSGAIKYWFGIKFADSPYDQTLTVKVVNNGYGIRANIEKEKLDVLIDFFKFFYSAEAANLIIKDGLMLPINSEITADITPLTESIIELTQDPTRTAVTGASYTWWGQWNFAYDCSAALDTFHLNGHEVLMNGLIDGSKTKDDIPVMTKQMDDAITEVLDYLAKQ